MDPPLHGTVNISLLCVLKQQPKGVQNSIFNLNTAVAYTGLLWTGLKHECFMVFHSFFSRVGVGVGGWGINGPIKLHTNLINAQIPSL